LKIVDELLDRTGSRQAILVGNSAGGTLALEYARTRPDRVQALILTSPAVYTGGGAPEWIKPILGSPQMRRIGPAIVRAAFEELARSGQGFTGAWYDASRAGPELRRAYGETLQVADWDRALFEFTLASRELGLPRVLAQIQQPTLVITGDSDRVVPTAESIRLAGELPNAQLLVIPQCGHVAQEECPAPMMEAVNRFLAGLR
jgi:pimeloyl-ACP methyl ester carboxylesterase